jgi:hypothetical protein
MKRLIAFLAIFISLPAFAFDGYIDHIEYSIAPAEPKLWVTLGGISKHDGERIDSSGQDYNEINPGFGVEYALTENWSLSTGVFHNSYNENSLYGAAFYQFLGDQKHRFGLSGGLFTGYPLASVIPNLMPAYIFEQESWGLNFFFSPGFSKDGQKVTNNTLVAQFKIRF